MLEKQRYVEAESFLRVYLDEAGKKFPDGWRTFAMQSALGQCMAGQARFSEAESLLKKGYEGLLKHEHFIPQNSRQARIDQAASRLAKLHESGNQPADASVDGEDKQ